VAVIVGEVIRPSTVVGLAMVVAGLYLQQRYRSQDAQ